MATQIADPFLLTAERNLRVQNEVMAALAQAMADAAAMRAEAEQAIGDIASFMPQLAVGGSGAPEAPGLPGFTFGRRLPNAPQAPDIDLTAPDAAVQAEPALQTVPVVSPVDIDDFDPTSGGVSLPAPPTLVMPTDEPQRPTLEEVELPSKPVLLRPYAPALVELQIPAFDFDALQYFDEAAPQFSGNLGVSAVLQWSNSEYEPEILPEVMARLRQMWDGGLGLPRDVEQAIYDRMYAREDLAIGRDIDAAYTEFASRGFTMPPGMLSARIDALRADGQRNKLAASRELAIRAADVQIENLRFACQQGIAAEQLLSTIYENMLRRGLDAARAEMDAQLSVLNAHVAVFNARQSAWSAQAQNRRAELETRLATMRMALDAELAKGEINKQNVALYAEQMRALQVDAQLYETEMRGASLQADVQKNRIDAYRADVQAFAERLGTLKVRADMYESQMRGEAARASVLDSSARAYAAYVQGQVSKVEAQSKVQEGALRSNEMRLRAWSTRLEADRTRVQAWLSGVQAKTAAYEARVRGYAAESGAVEALGRTELSAQEASARVAIQRYEAEIRKYLADLEQLRSSASMQLEAIKSAAQAMSTMAAGRMAGMSIGASVGASANMSASGTRSDSI